LQRLGILQPGRHRPAASPVSLAAIMNLSLSRLFHDST
jgi:hypothetical protein